MTAIGIALMVGSWVFIELIPWNRKALLKFMLILFMIGGALTVTGCVVWLWRNMP